MGDDRPVWRSGMGIELSTCGGGVTRDCSEDAADIVSMEGDEEHGRCSPSCEHRSSCSTGRREALRIWMGACQWLTLRVLRWETTVESAVKHMEANAWT